MPIADHTACSSAIDRLQSQTDCMHLDDSLHYGIKIHLSEEAYTDNFWEHFIEKWINELK